MLHARLTAMLAALFLAATPVTAQPVQEPPSATAERTGFPPLASLLLVSIGIIGVLYLLGTAIEGEETPESP